MYRPAKEAPIRVTPISAANHLKALDLSFRGSDGGRSACGAFAGAGRGGMSAPSLCTWLIHAIQSPCAPGVARYASCSLKTCITPEKAKKMIVGAKNTPAYQWHRRIVATFNLLLARA